MREKNSRYNAILGSLYHNKKKNQYTHQEDNRDFINLSWSLLQSQQLWYCTTLKIRFFFLKSSSEAFAGPNFIE